MKEGDIVLTLLPQTDGGGKYRPAAVLRRMPGFGDLLVWGISTQLGQQVADFDEIIEPIHTD
jgi:mRNA interferase MazF